MDAKTVTVALVEDESGVVERFERVIGANRRLELIHSCATATEMMNWLATHAVDVLLVDLGLPDRSGLDVINLCHRLQPHCEVMVITVFGDAEHMLEAFQAGARGYLVKDGTEAELAAHVLELHAGGSPMSPIIARQLLTRWNASGPKVAPGAPAAGGLVTPLSARELEVLQLVSRGCTYHETGSHLGITVTTVQAHVRNIYSKLEVHNKAEALYEARQLGLLN